MLLIRALCGLCRRHYSEVLQENPIHLETGPLGKQLASLFIYQSEKVN